ncbi:MAG: hypothetical protein ACU84H_00260 [Gammaproteobacteria bacterium]
MENTTYASIPFAGEDRSYRGSSFSEVRDAIFANPYQQQGGAEILPVYEVTLTSVLDGILPFGKRWRFLEAAERTVDSQADLRWGKDGKGFRRLLHPNGICLTGLWEITEETDYSGYFKKGSKGLVVGRYSTCCTETRRGRTRSLALTGKLFPTTDPDHSEALVTANFFTQQDLGGESCRFINEAELRNAPDTRAWRRGLGLPILLLTGVVLLRADKEPAIRQLYPIAELGKADDEATRAPEFMRLRVAADQPLIDGDDLDFRDEIMAHLYDPGDPVPKRALLFDIDVSDTGRTEGTPFFQRRTIDHWRTIGRITFTEAVASYNGDFVLHFNHPTWRDDRNNAATATRIEGHKVR